MPLRLLFTVRQHSAARFIMADFAAACAAAGHPTQFIDFCPLLHLPDGADKTARLQAELDAIAAFRPEVHLAYGMEAFAPLPGCGDLFSRLQLPTVNLFYDFHDWDIAKLCAHPLFSAMTGPDCLYACWDRVALARLHADGFYRAHYLPLGVNPADFRTEAAPGAARPVPVSFIGIATDERIRLLRPLADAGLVIHGPGADRWRVDNRLNNCYRGPEHDREKLNAIYNASGMTVNITQAHGNDSLNMRVFEALACGCLLLTDDKPVLRGHFRPGEELVIHHGDDLPDLVRYFRAHPEEAAAIAARGAAAVCARHTYAQRVVELTALFPAWLRQRAAYRAALKALAGGQVRAGDNALRALAAADPPFGNPAHLLQQLTAAARQAGRNPESEPWYAPLAARCTEGKQ